jgi:UDP-glucose 4-epimerase
MSVLVTGGAGYIGSHMVLALTDAGEDVVVLDNLSTGHWWAISPKARLVEGDIGNEELLDRLMAEHRFDAVVHFAGSIVSRPEFHGSSFPRPPPSMAIR